MKHLIIFIFLFLVFLQNAYASDALDISAFATIPIQHEGRIKPMDSFARAQLKSFSGKESLSDMPATQWLIETLFNPSMASSIEIFKIRNPEVLQLLALPRRALYSFDELMPKILQRRDIIISILNTPQDKWTQAQNDLITLQQKIAVYEQLLSSLSGLLPLSLRVPNDVPDYMKDHAGKTINYRDILKFREQVEADLKQIIKDKGEDPANYTPTEQVVAMMSFAVNQLQQKGATNMLFTVLPTTDGTPWKSLWDVLINGGTPQTVESLAAWQNLVTALTEQNGKKWSEACATLKQQPATRINAEYTYNLLHPHETSMGFYLISLILACGALLLRFPFLLSWSGYALATGVFIHLSGIATRIYILERPPVSTLYETILFVGMIFVIYGLILWLNKRDTYALIGAGLGGVILHLIGFSHAGENDSLIQLEAVLNTNFWLATHVLCITTGYAFCLITSALAHLHLTAQALKKPLPAHLQTGMMTAGLLALFFASIGTVLGGIWADQSWGRFWGWDPKENGALLIVLWLIWVIHGRISGQMPSLFFLAGLSYLAVIVSLSWFGVNLLSVGLHSYGFTNSLAWGLGSFVAAETLLIGFLWRKAHAQ